MISDIDLAGLHTNQRLVVKEMIRRGIEVDVLDARSELLVASYSGHRELMLDRDTGIVPYHVSVLAGNKARAKWLLAREGIMVPKGMAFYADQKDALLDFAQGLGYPLVLKPTFGSHGDGVYMDLDNLLAVKLALDALIRDWNPDRILVEEQFEGKEHRVFVTRNGDYAVLHREPAHVVGDGTHTIEELARIETDRRMNPRTTCLCPVAMDDITAKYLQETGLSLGSVPSEGQKIYTSHSSNVARGGIPIDMTDKVHPSLIKIGMRSLEAFPGLPYAGVDILTKDSAIEQTDDIYRVLEVNTNPGVHMHMNPGIGQARDVARYMVDLIFPETNG